MENRRILFGIVLALLLIGVVAGVGWTAYNAGITQGVVESGKLVPLTTEGGVAPTAPYGFYRPFGVYRPFGFGFGLLGCLVPILFLFLLFGLFRFMFRPRWGGPWMRGSGWDPSKGDIPPGVKEWHRKLHDEETQATSNQSA